MDSGMNDTLNSDYMTFITKASRHFSDEPYKNNPTCASFSVIAFMSKALKINKL